MIEVDRQTALRRVLALVLLCPGATLGRRSTLAGELVPPSPGLAQPLHVAVEDGEQPVLRPAVAAPCAPGVAYAHRYADSVGWGSAWNFSTNAITSATRMPVGLVLSVHSL